MNALIEVDVLDGFEQRTQTPYIAQHIVGTEFAQHYYIHTSHFDCISWLVFVCLRACGIINCSYVCTEAFAFRIRNNISHDDDNDNDCIINLRFRLRLWHARYSFCTCAFCTFRKTDNAMPTHCLPIDRHAAWWLTSANGVHRLAVVCRCCECVELYRDWAVFDQSLRRLSSRTILRTVRLISQMFVTLFFDCDSPRHPYLILA